MLHRKIAWETLGGGLQSVRLLRLQLDRAEGPLHAHDALELTWIERGQGLRWVGSRIEPFGDDDLVLLGPRLAHRWQTRGSPAGGVRATVLQLMPRAELQALPEWRGVQGLLQRAAQGLALQGRVAQQVQQRLSALPEAPGLALLGGALALLDALAGQVELDRARGDGSTEVRVLDAAAPRLLRPDLAQQRRLDALLAWVEQHLGAELRVADAAALLHVSPAAFSRSFARLTGRRFGDYLNERRISEACLQLRQGDRPVAEVARQVGFATLSHFNAEFLRRVGSTPSRYRRA